MEEIKQRKEELRRTENTKPTTEAQRHRGKSKKPAADKTDN
jgi:hypothetical protein